MTLGGCPWCGSHPHHSIGCPIARGIVLPTPKPEPLVAEKEALAQGIRIVDGNHSLGAAALVDALFESGYLVERAEVEKETAGRIREAQEAAWFEGFDAMYDHQYNDGSIYRNDNPYTPKEPTE